MKKMNIVKKNTEFSYIMKDGKKYYCDILNLYIIKNSYNYNRFGISISKKIGSAVIRNKFKRQIKDIIDNLDIKFNGYDILLISRSNLKDSNYLYIKSNILNLFNFIKYKFFDFISIDVIGNSKLI